MKKILLSAMCVAALAGVQPVGAQEVTYVEDCTQGVLLNPNKDNWFISAQGGVNMLFGKDDSKASFKNRLGSNAGLFFGKWISPNFGFRVGGIMMQSRGGTTADGKFRDYGHSAFSNGYYPQKSWGFGAEADVMINMTNWILGYRPYRFYNAVVHVGGGSVWAAAHRMKGNTVKWKQVHDRVLFANVGFQNNFQVSKAVGLYLDVVGQLDDYSQADYHVALYAGITYNFKSRTWSCPKTAVCPTWKYTDAEGDALQARLSAADGRIAELQNQLDDCRNRPNDANYTGANCDAPLAVVYYPINVSTLSSREKTLLNSVAQVMKENPNQKYILTGWADNYTGDADINIPLRHARVDNVKAYLINCGVDPGQLDAGIDNNNRLEGFGPGSASLDRAVTIKAAK